jgi:hypothetical protein
MRPSCRIGQRRAEFFRACIRITAHRRRIEQERCRRALQRIGHCVGILDAGDSHLRAEGCPFCRLFLSTQDDTHGFAAFHEGARCLAAGPTVRSKHNIHDHHSFRSLDRETIGASLPCV